MGTRKELDLAEDMRHQRREWKAEHVGWWVMGAILLAALLGLAGPGPLSLTTTGTPGSNLWVEHQRFARYQAPMEIKVHFRQPMQDDEIRIAMDREFYASTESEISPPPEKTELRGDRVSFVFPARSASGHTGIIFRAKPTQRGSHRVRIWLDDEHSVTLRIFIFP